MKKILLSLGTIVATVVPVATIIACGVATNQNIINPKEVDNTEDNSTNSSNIDPKKTGNNEDKTIDPINTNENRSGDSGNSLVVPSKNGGNNSPEEGANLNQIENTYANSVLFSQASNAKEIEDTDHDFVRVGGEGMTIINEGIVALHKYSKFGDSVNNFAELRPGDYLEFVFDDIEDIKDFTNRVLYDDAQLKFNIDASGNGGAEMKDLRFTPYVVKNNEVIANDEITSASEDGVKESIFKLSTPKQNVVRMTFNNIFNGSKEYIDAQKLYLRGFSDQNEDGINDINDVQMTSMFLLEKTNLPDAYGVRSNKWNNLIAGYHSEVVAQKIAEVEEAKLAKIEEEKRLAALQFDESAIQWGTTIDLNSLKDGDFIGFDGDGVQQVLCVTMNEDGSFMGRYSTGGESITYTPMTIIDQTHVEHIKKGDPLPPPFFHDVDKTLTFEITRMGTI